MAKSRFVVFQLFCWRTLFMVVSCALLQAREIDSTLMFQNPIEVPVSEYAKELFNKRDFDKLRILCSEQIPILLHGKQKDSLEIALLNFYQYEVQAYDKDYLACIKSTQQGIRFCKNDDSGTNLKGMLHYKQAYAESNLNFTKRASKSMALALSIFSNLKIPNYDYSIGAYNFLSQGAAYRGDLEEAQRLLRLSEKFYRDHKKVVDSTRRYVDGFYDRYEVIIPYKKLYTLYKRGTTKTDSIQLIGLMNQLERLHASPKFSVPHESIYYTTALNHVGDWYASKTSEENIHKEDLEKARYYIDKSIHLIDNKGYKGDPYTFKYNKSKLLALSNELPEAEELMSNLLSRLAENDGRRPFFIAQNGLVKAKMKQKDSALAMFYQVIEHIHSGEEKLNKDYSNFVPNDVFGETKLILRVAEVLQMYYPKDHEVKTYVARLYFMALLQFEQSYRASSFNSTYNKYLRNIIQGVLAMKKDGYGLELMDNKDFLNRTETIQNQLAWKQFNQNRFLNSLPALDSLKLRKLNLRTMMAQAKQEENFTKQDSVHELIIENDTHTNILYPNLTTLSEKYFQVQELQQLLAPDEIIIKYMLLDEQMATYVISKDEVKIDLQPWSSHDKNLVISLYEDIKKQQYSAEKAQQLASLLLPELDSKINHIIIDPDGELYRFPFEVLHLDNAFLIDRYRVSYTSNLGFVYPTLKKQDDSAAVELAIYVPEYNSEDARSATRGQRSPLSGAQKEATLISALFPSKIYTGVALTKQKFLKTLKNTRLLHLAMHARVNNDDPSLSKLLLGETDNDDDDVYLEELYGLSLRAELAVLSACDTGLGKENAGRSMESFQRAFTFAGVPTTVASLWEVPDNATKEIMFEFYSQLKNGLSKSESLQIAKKEFKAKHANTKLAAPYYWAGFVIYGSDLPVFEATRGFFWYGIGFSMIVLAILVFWMRKKRKTI